MRHSSSPSNSRCLLVFAVAGTVFAIGSAADAAEVAPLPAAKFREAFFSKEDVPKGFFQQAKPEPTANPPVAERFRELGGLQAGMAVWGLSPFGDVVAYVKEPVHRIQMTCWEFPNAAAAAKYLDPVPKHIHDDADREFKAPKVGEDCRVYGPRNRKADEYAKERGAPPPRAFAYVFRVDRVVVLVFLVCRPGDDAPKSEVVALPYAKKAEALVRKAYGITAARSETTSAQDAPRSRGGFDSPAVTADGPASINPAKPDASAMQVSATTSERTRPRDPGDVIENEGSLTVSDYDYRPPGFPRSVRHDDLGGSSAAASGLLPDIRVRREPASEYDYRPPGFR